MGSPLALKELTLSHFRSHKRARLSLDGRPVVLHGANGAGKTNILEAVSMLSPGRGLRRATMDEMIRRPEMIGWKISAIIQSLGHAHEVETWVEPGQGRQVRIDGKLSTQIMLGQLTRLVWLVPVMDRLWVEGAEGRRRFLDRLTLSFTPSHAEAVLAYEKAMRHRNRLLKDGQRDAHWYRAIEAQMAQSGAQIAANRLAAIQLLQEAQADAETEFPIAELSLAQADGEEMPQDEAELGVALAESRARDLRAGRTLVGPHRTDLSAVYTTKGVAARDCSTGEQKALLVSLILANGRALARDFGAPPIYLLDEVAAHLDAGRRAALYDEICALGAQAFMTGTGPELFAELGRRAAHFEVCEGADGSTLVAGKEPS